MVLTGKRLLRDPPLLLRHSHRLTHRQAKDIANTSTPIIEEGTRMSFSPARPSHPEDDFLSSPHSPRCPHLSPFTAKYTTTILWHASILTPSSMSKVKSSLFCGANTTTIRFSFPDGDLSVVVKKGSNTWKKIEHIARQVSSLGCPKFERRFRFTIQEEEIKNISLKVNNGDNMLDLNNVTEASTGCAFCKPAVTREEKELDEVLHPSVSRFYNAKDYQACKTNFAGDKLMDKTNLTFDEASKIVNTHCPQLVESVVILKNNWFFMTSFSVFIHNNPQVDDCADLSKVGHQEKMVAIIRRKTRLGKDYFELTFRFGYVEVLATGGFFGSVKDMSFSPFLGSSIANLPTSITGSIETVFSSVIYTSINKKEFLHKKRLLNQYYKAHAMYDWAFHISRFYKEGFVHADPLNYKSQVIMHTAASFLINSFASKKVSDLEVKETLTTVLSLDDSSFTSVNKLIKKYIVFLGQNLQSSFFKAPKETKNDMITV
ncbi:unnamed protein product [Mucor hiemalis]